MVIQQPRRQEFIAGAKVYLGGAILSFPIVQKTQGNAWSLGWGGRFSFFTTGAMQAHWPLLAPALLCSM